MNLLKQLDKNLLHLAWSLWTELGVAGTEQNHQNTLILMEELILFTSVLAEIDPRLRDESLDWCSQFHHYISISRLKSLIKEFDSSIYEPFSKYASTLNNISKTNWPVLIASTPSNIFLSRKSILRPRESPALLNIRARGIFCTGARADLITFLLVHSTRDFSIVELAEIGYSKRNLAEILDDLYLGNLFDRFMQGNQYRYRLKKNSPLFQALYPLPKQAPSWRLIFKILLSLRTCIQHSENYSESSKVVELSNCLHIHRESLQKLQMTPPASRNDPSAYLKAFQQWILEWTFSLAQGNW